ncbi:hypothetical protein E2C01_034672 [Portunus trituberculatus]|uniref:Uncharacterized protein n=1 Tax=Portunus trituberculatus TaxID=210409 RepID=A0A5B7F169_PORTR|nr:hypothetical protein [Portunus trituberculatus]
MWKRSESRGRSERDVEERVREVEDTRVEETRGKGSLPIQLMNDAELDNTMTFTWPGRRVLAPGCHLQLRYFITKSKVNLDF